MEDRLLRIEEVARLLSLGRSKTYDLVRRGELECVHIGCSVRVRAGALQRFIEGLAADPGVSASGTDSGR